MKAESNVKRIASYFSLTPPLNSFKEARSIDQIVRIFFSQKGKKPKMIFVEKTIIMLLSRSTLNIC